MKKHENNDNPDVIRYQKKSRKSIIRKEENTDRDVDTIESVEHEDLEATKEISFNQEVLASTNQDDLHIQSFQDNSNDNFNGDNNNSKGDPMAKKKKKQPKKKIGWLVNTLAVISAFFLVGFLAVSLFVVSTIIQSGPISIDDFEKNDSSVVLDADDNIIYDLGAKLIHNIEYEDISQSLVDAFLAIEDSRFFDHNGFDSPRFTSAILKNTLSSLSRFKLSFDAGGASTLDMQLVKNSLFMSENVVTGESQMPDSSGIAGIKRKVKEIYFSQKINNKQILSKKVIFQMYVNAANFGTGGNMLGVQKAAEFYFDKTVSELNLVESAFLAGVINRPAYNTPYYRLSYAQERTDKVLELMNYHGYITDEEYKLALSVPLENLFVEKSGKKGDAMPNQAYIDVVLNEVTELTGLNPLTTPMVIKTSMNPELQKELDKIQNREYKELDFERINKSIIQIASTVMDNRTGEIIGIIGGYDYYGQRVLNRSTDMLYQPGSTIKPFVDYAPAFEYLGYATSHVLFDEPYYWPNTNILVRNYNNRYKGDIGLLTAVGDSLNIPAIKTFEEVEKKIGKARYTEFIESMGFTRYKDKTKKTIHEQFAIGGDVFVSNTQEIAGASATILNGGSYIKPHTIREIYRKDTQETIVSPYKATPVLSEAAAYLTARTMKEVADTSPVMARIKRSYQVYGKTGTTNNADDSRKARLLVTGTDRFSMATWTGFDDKDAANPKVRTYMTDSEAGAQIHSKINKHILDVLDREYGKGKEIPKPDDVVEITHILGTFPYQKTIEGMNPQLIAKGLIKKDSAKLVDSSAPSLDNLASMDNSIVNLNNRNYVNVNFSNYPDLEKLQVASNTVTMKDRSGKTYTGQRLYDPSWIYGAVRYRADLYVDDQVIDSVSSDTQTLQIELPRSATDNVKVCGYYTFDLNTNIQSNVICSNVDTSNISESITVPSFSGSSNETSLEQVKNFANNNGITLNLSKYYDEISNFGKLANIDPDLRNQTIVLDQIPKTWKVVFYDFNVKVADYTPNTLKQTIGKYVNVVVQGNGQTIDKVLDGNNQPVSEFSLYENYRSTITIITK